MTDQPVNTRRRTDLAALQAAFRTIRPASAAAEARAIEVARHEIDARRRRRRVFGEEEGLLGDPIWDALLELFVAQAEDRPISTTSLVHAMHLPASTGLRWIDHMEERGLLTRATDLRDRRRSLIRPTEHARLLVIHSLEPLWRARIG
jgi:hypothetical protein